MRRGFAPILLVAGFVIVFVLIGGLYNSHKKSSSPVERKSAVQTQLSSSPSASPTERTIQESGGSVLINFGNCAPDARRIDVAFGSTTIEVIGKEGNYCLMNFGGEVENPNNGGRLTTKCKVPASLVTKEFNKGGQGVDTSLIGQYCSRM